MEEDSLNEMQQQPEYQGENGDQMEGDAMEEADYSDNE